MSDKKKYLGARLRQEKIIPLSSKAKPVPKGFVQYKIGKHIYVLCNKIASQGNAICEFSLRKDQIKDLSQLTHKCKAPSIDKFFAKKSHPNSKLDELYSMLGKCAVSTCNSVRSACSTDMWNLLHCAVELGMSCGLSDPEIALPVIGRKKLTSIIDKDASDFSKKQMKIMSQEECCSLSIDAGKIGSIHYIVGTLSSPINNIRPFPFLIRSSFIGTSDNYRKLFKEIVEKLDSQQISISGVVTDSLRAQVSALDREKNEDIYLSSKFENTKSASWIPCANHQLHLAILNSIQENSVFDHHLKIVNNSAMFLNKKPVSIVLGLSVPITSSTRWGGIFILSKWILKHRIDGVKSRVHLRCKP